MPSGLGAWILAFHRVTGRGKAVTPRQPSRGGRWPCPRLPSRPSGSTVSGRWRTGWKPGAVWQDHGLVFASAVGRPGRGERPARVPQDHGGGGPRHGMGTAGLAPHLRLLDVRGRRTRPRSRRLSRRAPRPVPALTERGPRPRCCRALRRRPGWWPAPFGYFSSGPPRWRDGVSMPRGSARPAAGMAVWSLDGRRPRDGLSWRCRARPGTATFLVRCRLRR
jgi:hypothetical protein